MKKALAMAMAAALMLGGCAAGTGAEDMAALYRDAGEISAQAQVSILADGVAMSYIIEYKRTGDEATVTILSPESLSGLSAKLTNQEGDIRIEYKGASVEALLPSLPGFSPVDGLHGVLGDIARALPAAETEARWEDIPCLMLTFTDESNGVLLEKQVWLERDSGAVRHCEFYMDGTMVMALDVLSMSVF